jgi:hypothetical protein
MMTTGIRSGHSNLYARPPLAALHFRAWPPGCGGGPLGCAASLGCCIRAACSKRCSHVDKAWAGTSLTSEQQRLQIPSHTTSYSISTRNQRVLRRRISAQGMRESSNTRRYSTWQLLAVRSEPLCKSKFCM